MKGFRKLLRGMLQNCVTILTLFFIMAMVMAMCWLIDDNNEVILFVGILSFVIFAVLVFLSMTIYIVAELYLYDRARKRLRAIPYFSEERFAREIKRAPKIKNILLCSDAVCYYEGFGLSLVKVIPIAEIVWAYQGEQRLCMITKDREKHEIVILTRMKNKDAAARYILRLIARKNKGALIGYDRTYEEWYQKDFPRLQAMAQGEIVNSGWLEQEYIQNNYYERDYQ